MSQRDEPVVVSEHQLVRRYRYERFERPDRQDEGYRFLYHVTQAVAQGGQALCVDKAKKI